MSGKIRSGTEVGVQVKSGDDIVLKARVLHKEARLNYLPRIYM